MKPFFDGNVPPYIISLTSALLLFALQITFIPRTLTFSYVSYNALAPHPLRPTYASLEQ